MEAEFTRLSALLEADGAKRQAIGKEVKEINRIFRTIQFTLHAVHNVVQDQAAVLSVCRQARQQFQELAPIWQRIFEMIAGESVEKYRAHWKFVTEQLVFLAAFAHWLETHQLITLAEVVQLIGVGTNPIYAIPSITTASGSSPDSATSTAAATGVGLDLDDYLLGLTSLPNELSRLCINSVRVGNYELPRQVAAFISDLYSGFRLLHLTNGDLRRRFDAIKYAVAKVEEVLYDCTVRGLGTSASASSSSNAAVNAASKPLAVGSQEAAPVGADSDVTMQ